MFDELTIRICGEAGQGVQTVGGALCAIYKNAGLSIFANHDYMSRIRGGNNFYQIRVAGRPLYTLRAKADMIVALDGASVALHAGALADGGIILLDSKKLNLTDKGDKYFDVPFSEIAVKTAGSEMFINSVACGVLACLTAIAPGLLEKTVQDIFQDKSEDVRRKNLEAARAGYEFVSSSSRKNSFLLKAGTTGGKFLMNGNEAVALGAIRSGCKFYSAYPMSPSTGIMEAVARYAGQFNIIVEQAEDEIAAINMVLGASFAGARSMTASSGGGFALMVEGVSLSGMTETPAVIAVVQRPGPATGFPTRTEQADLNFILAAGHGEFSRAVFAPGTVEEAFYLTVRAFNLAEKYQIPVFIISDQHLADSYRDIAGFDLSQAQVSRYIISKSESSAVKNYKRYALTDSGISPRAIPSWIEDVVYVDSDEHTEEGHITEDAGVRTAMVEKRLYKKLAGLSGEIEKPVFANLETAGVTLIGFGSTCGVLKEVSEKLNTGFIHLPQLWPFPSQDLAGLLKNAKKIITVENNATAQLAGLIRRQTGIKADKSILKFDGRPFDLDYLCERIKGEL